jgi:hypothetical protein
VAANIVDQATGTDNCSSAPSLGGSVRPARLGSPLNGKTKIVPTGVGPHSRGSLPSGGSDSTFSGEKSGWSTREKHTDAGAWMGSHRVHPGRTATDPGSPAPVDRRSPIMKSSAWTDRAPFPIGHAGAAAPTRSVTTPTSSSAHSDHAMDADSLIEADSRIAGSASLISPMMPAPMVRTSP